jgi:hypothetical protein
MEFFMYGLLGALFPVGEEYVFFFLYSVRTCSGADPTSTPVVTGGFFLGVNAAWT